MIRTKEYRDKMSRIMKNKVHSGWFKKGQHPSFETEIKEGEHKSPNTEFKKGREHFNYGRKLPKWIRDKIGNANGGEKNHNYGKHLSKDCKRKISNKLKGKLKPKRSLEHKRSLSIARLKLNISGKNHYNWQGGKSFELYSIEFDNRLKRQVKERDEYICQMCGEIQKKRKFHIHHIDYNKKNNDIRNLITLCGSCHTKTNFERKDWQEFFTKKINRFYELKLIKRRKMG